MGYWLCNDVSVLMRHKGNSVLTGKSYVLLNRRRCALSKNKCDYARSKVNEIFNVAAARGATWMISRRKSSLFGRLAFLLVAGCLVLNCLLTVIFSVLSINNYPGGKALARFNEMYTNRQAMQVNISNLAAQTGASLFQQTHAPPYFPDLGVRPPPLAYDWVYNKTEDVSPTSITTDCSITHAIVEIRDGIGMNAW
ncbi:hypothetical protein BC835DRAFT_1469381, partial [Cytidiella melzeri]